MLNRREFIKRLIFNSLGIITINLIIKPSLLYSENKKTIPKGIFCVTNTTNWVLKDGQRVNLFDYEIDGVVNYVRWADIEKEPLKFNWNGLERMLKEADIADKQLSYNIIPGIHAPEWLYNKYKITPYEYTYDKKGKKVKTYLHFIEKNGKRVLNEEFLNIWKRTINNFALYVRNHKLKNRIAYIAITGGPTSNGLEVMWGEHYYDEFKRIGWDKDTEHLFVEFWERVIDIFMEAFPDVPLGLAITDFFGVNPSGTYNRNYQIPKIILNYALNKAKEKNVNLVVMGFWIGAISPYQYNTHPLINLIKSLDSPFAFQGPMGTNSYEALEKMLSFAYSSGASWIELWHHDIINESYRSLIKAYRSFYRNKK
jgi:hypothetical protein